MRLHEINAPLHKKFWQAPKVVNSAPLRRLGARRPALSLRAKVFLGGSVLVALICFCLFGPVFNIEEIRVSGAGVKQGEISALINSHIQSQKRFFIFSQKKIFLFNSGQVSEKILNQFIEVKGVAAVSRDWPGVVSMEIEERLETFGVEEAVSKYILGQDGKIMRSLKAAEAFPVSVTLLRWPLGIVLMNEEGFVGDKIKRITELREGTIEAGIEKVHKIDLLPAAYARELVPDESKNKTNEKDNDLLGQDPEVTEEAEKSELDELPFDVQNKLSGEAVMEVSLPASLGGSKFYVLVNADGKSAGEVTRQLKLLLGQQNLDRLKRIFYLDMRYPDRGYLCLENAECAKNLPWQLQYK